MHQFTLDLFSGFLPELSIGGASTSVPKPFATSSVKSEIIRTDSCTHSHPLLKLTLLLLGRNGASGMEAESY